MKPIDPTPDEIKRMCLLIQATWTAAERMKRLRHDLRPVVRTADDRLIDVSVEDFEIHENRGISCQK